MTVRLRDIADIRSGYSFRGRVDNDPAGDLGVVSMRDIVPDQPIDPEQLVYIDSTSLNDVEKYRLREGDVVFQSRGYHNRAAIVGRPLNAIASLGLYNIRAKPERALGFFIAWFFNQPRTQNRIASLAQGTQIPFVTRAELALLSVPLPKMEVQKQIAEMYMVRAKQRHLQKKLDSTTDKLINKITWELASSNS